MDFWILLCVGILLVILEIFFASFFLIFLGLGFIFAGLFELAFGFSSFGVNPIVLQAIFIAVISIVLLIFLKPYFKKLFSSSEKLKEDFLDESGEGEIKDNMVYFKGTLWAFEGSAKYSEGQIVKIKGVKNNRLILE